MRLLSSAAAAAALFSACAIVQAAPAEALDVRLSTPQPVLQGDVDVFVDVTVTNTSRHPVHVPKWQLPQDDWEAPLLLVTRDSQQTVRYLGRLVKRGSPSAADHVKLEPGASLSFRVELTRNYDLSQDGLYTLQYLAKGGQGETLASAPLHLWLQGRSGKAPGDANLVSLAAAGSLSFTNCSSSQSSTISSAVSAAKTMAGGGSSYLNSNKQGPRYTTWFGTYTSSRYSTVKSHFTAIYDAFVNKAVTVDCSCSKSYYAYVYPTQPYKIYVCNAFWSAPLTGTDSKGGTLVHEMSHFNVVASTDDWAYGQTAAKSLAISNPSQAIDNADSHEYFAENTPALN